MDNQVLVSVVVPIFNMENVLERCVTSILQQTYKKIEVILVNDGSTDNSLGESYRLANKYSDIRVIDKENGGVSTARNTGIDYASGEWVMFVDPDDFLDSTIIEKLLVSANINSDIVACSCTTIENETKYICHFFDGDFTANNLSEKEPFFHQLMDRQYGQVKGNVYTGIGVPWGKIYRKSLIDRCNLRFDNKLRRVQDNIFNMYAMYYAREIVYIDQPLYMYSFEHMGGYFSSYKKNFVDIFFPVIKARSKAVRELNLIDNEVLYKAYVNETIIALATIFKCCVFHRNNEDNRKTKKKVARDILNDNSLKITFQNKSFVAINGIKYKLFWIICKLQLLTLLEVICITK